MRFFGGHNWGLMDLDAIVSHWTVSEIAECRSDPSWGRRRSFDPAKHFVSRRIQLFLRGFPSLAFLRHSCGFRGI